MKTINNNIILLAIAMSIVMFLTGCKRQEIEPVCFHWAPEGCTISSTEYNSPLEIRNYFFNHDSTMLAHDGDTIKIWGWVYYHGSGEPVLWPFETDPLREAWSPEAGYIVLVGNEDHHGWLQSIKVYWDNTDFLQTHPGFSQNFDSYLPKKWYVTARQKCTYNPVPTPCETIGANLYVIAIDTIPNM